MGGVTETTWSVVFLGTGASLTTSRRGNTSLALRLGRTILLVDCAPSVVGALHASESPLESVGNILLTHRHVDHLGGLPSFVHQAWLGSRLKRRPPLTLWGPDEALGVARRLLDSVGLTAKRDMFELRYRTLPLAPHTAEMDGLAVKTFPVAHKGVPTVGLRCAPIGRPAAAVVYSADSEPCDAVFDESRAARLLIHECTTFDAPRLSGHTSLVQLLERLETTPVPAVRLVHLPPVEAAREAEVSTRLRHLWGERVRLAGEGEISDVKGLREHPWAS